MLNHIFLKNLCSDKVHKERLSKLLFVDAYKRIKTKSFLIFSKFILFYIFEFFIQIFIKRAKTEMIMDREA